MKTTILFFSILLITSCGKSAMDGPVAGAKDATPLPLTTAAPTKTQMCLSQCSNGYDNCMKYLQPTDPYDLRVKITEKCERIFKISCGEHCDWCDSVEWDKTRPQVFTHPETCTSCTGRYCVGFVPVCTQPKDTHAQCEETNYNYNP